MTDKPRLIEHAFPLKEASLDSVREKNGGALLHGAARQAGQGGLRSRS